MKFLGEALEIPAATADQHAVRKLYVDQLAVRVADLELNGGGGTGTAGTVAVGTTTTGAPGTDADVTNSGTSTAAILNFTIPEGEKGDKGDKGDSGLTLTPTVVVTADYAAIVGDFVRADATAAPLTVTLPAPVAGTALAVKKVDGSGNAVTVVSAAGQINDAASLTLTGLNETRQFVADAVGWYSVGRDGSVTLATGERIMFGTDTNLYRYAANVLGTDDAIRAAGTVSSLFNDGALAVELSHVGLRSSGTTPSELVLRSGAGGTQVKVNGSAGDGTNGLHVYSGGAIPALRGAIGQYGVGLFLMPAGGNVFLQARREGETGNRLVISNVGAVQWSNGTLAADTNLYRQGVGLLGTDTAFKAASLTTGNQSTVRSYLLQFGTGTNEKIDFYVPGEVHAAFEVTLAGTYQGAPAGGSIKALYSISGQAAGTTWGSSNSFTVLAAQGNIVDHFALMPPSFDAANSRWRFTVAHRTNTTNMVAAEIRMISPSTTYQTAFQGGTYATSAVYTDATVVAANQVPASAATNGLPSGGSASQALVKNSGTDYDASWLTLVPTGGTSGQVLAKTSGTDYDSGWVTVQQVPAGGTTGQVLSKVSGTDHATTWSTVSGLLPTGGATGQILAKTSGTDYAATWIAAPAGVPAGGTTGQVLAKTSGTDYDATWNTLRGVPAGGTTGQALLKNSSTDADASWSTIRQVPAGGNEGQYLATIGGTPTWSDVPLRGGDDLAVPLTAGEAACDRRMVLAGPASNVATGLMYMVHLRAVRTETINKITFVSAATAAAGLTLARLAIYSEAANGDLTLVAATANDTTLFAAAYTRYTRNFTTPFAKIAGVRYVVAMMFAGTTMPSMYQSNLAGHPVINDTFAVSPRLCSRTTVVATDLPASVPAASVANSRMIFYCEVAP